MSNVKRYAVALVLGGLAALFLLIWALASTVWAPATQIEASGESDRPFVMTRAGVLPLYNDDVTVTVTGEDAEETVWMAVGTAEDITAWLANRPYDEVIGLEDLNTLKFVDVPGADAPESGEAAEEGGGAEPSSDPLASDMWLGLNEGTGTITKHLSPSFSDKSILIASNGVDPAPTLTLTWETTTSNVVAWVALALAGIAAVLAALSAWGTYAAQRRRRLRAERLRQSFSADTTQTAMIPTVAAPSDEQDEDASGAELDPEPTPEGEAEETVDAEPEAAAEAVTDVEVAEVAGPVSTEETELPGDAETAAVAEEVDEPGEPETDPAASSEPAAERVETISTDSGMINLTALQGGGVFPTRRALREAQTRGVEKVVVEGQEFETGTQPAIDPQVSPEETADHSTSEVLGNRSSRGSKWRDAFSGRKGRAPGGDKEGSSE